MEKFHNYFYDMLVFDEQSKFYLIIYKIRIFILSSEATFSPEAPWIWRLLPDYYIDDIWDFLMSAAMYVSLIDLTMEIS